MDLLASKNVLTAHPEEDKSALASRAEVVVSNILNAQDIPEALQCVTKAEVSIRYFLIYLHKIMHIV